jgi:hypothetical protein
MLLERFSKPPMIMLLISTCSMPEHNLAEISSLKAYESQKISEKQASDSFARIFLEIFVK